jgi:hypothetical protein
MKNVIKNQGVTIYQENKDCVVVNGVFSGCVFAIPQPNGKKQISNNK